MSYRNAQEILPQELTELIQQYVDGDFLYIPRKDEGRRKWGEGTNIRSELAQRDEQIYEDHLQGIPVAELAEKYFLSPKSIQRIVYRQRKRDMEKRTF